STRQQVDRSEREQEIWDKDSCPRVILGHSLAEEQRQDRQRGDQRAVKRDCRIARDNQKQATERAQCSGGDFEKRQRRKQQRHHSRQRTLREMPPQPLEITRTINNLVDARLDKENG